MGVGAGLAHIVLILQVLFLQLEHLVQSLILGVYLAIFPRVRITTFLMLGFFLEDDAYSSKMVLAILVSLSKSVAILHGWLWCCRWWCCIHGTHWWLCNRLCNWLSIQENHTILNTYGTRYGYDQIIERINH